LIGDVGPDPRREQGEDVDRNGDTDEAERQWRGLGPRPTDLTGGDGPLPSGVGNALRTALPDRSRDRTLDTDRPLALGT
jgi:hypothetical protein